MQRPINQVTGNYIDEIAELQWRCADLMLRIDLLCNVAVRRLVRPRFDTRREQCVAQP